MSLCIRAPAAYRSGGKNGTGAFEYLLELASGSCILGFPVSTIGGVRMHPSMYPLLIIISFNYPYRGATCAQRKGRRRGKSDNLERFDSSCFSSLKCCSGSPLPQPYHRHSCSNTNPSHPSTDIHMFSYTLGCLMHYPHAH